MSADQGADLAKDLEQIQAYLLSVLSEGRAGLESDRLPRAHTPQARKLLTLIRTMNKRSGDQDGATTISRILDDAGQTYWLWDIVTGALKFSPGWARHTGLPETYDALGLEPWLEHVVAADRVRLMAAIRDHLSGATPRLAIDYRLQTARGAIQWIRCTGQCERDEFDNPIRLAGTHRDVSIDHEKNDSAHRAGASKGKPSRTVELICDALENGGVVPFFQPIVRLKDRKLQGLEALVRLHDKDRGIIAPREFLATAERSDLIVSLGDRVLELALRGLASARSAGKLEDDAFVSVNISSRQLLEGDLPSRIAAALQRESLPPSCLQLELTETVLISNLAFAKKTLNALRRAGIRIALDDFGAGYSSLNYLQELPIDVLKVDRRFVRQVDRNKARIAILQTIASLAEALNIPLIAEGVETETEAKTLRELGVTYAQGYLFAKPAPLSVQIALLNEADDAPSRVVQL
ncbi:MAG: EAL domain-containing protein [Pseudomonadota bacterium]